MVSASPDGRAHTYPISPITGIVAIRLADEVVHDGWSLEARFMVQGTRNPRREKKVCFEGDNVLGRLRLWRGREHDNAKKSGSTTLVVGGE